jgi:RNA polymerase sigma-B factor
MTADSETVRALFRTYRRDGDRRVRDQLVELHMGLAQTMASRFRGRGESHDDLLQVASLGLLKAIERFDPCRGVEFSTFAVPTITGELKRHFRDKGWMVRVPRSVQELRSEIKVVTSELTHELSRSPKVAEIADRVGCRVEQVIDALDAGSAYRSDSLDAPSTGDGIGSVVDRLGSVDNEIETMLDREEIRRLLEMLPPRERRIVTLRFFGGLTQSEISEQVGVSQMHVSRLLSHSLGRLRERVNAGRCPEPAASETLR